MLRWDWSGRFDLSYSSSLQNKLKRFLIRLNALLVHLKDGDIDHLHRRAMTGGERFHDPVPDASLPPAQSDCSKCFVADSSLAGSAVAHLNKRPKKDAVEHATAIFTPNAARLVATPFVCKDC